MNKQRLLYYSILASMSSVIYTLVVNLQIADAYLKTSGKSRALFGLIEYLVFSHQYYIVVLGLLSLFLAIRGRSESRHFRKFAIIFSLVAIAIVFLRIWRMFI